MGALLVLYENYPEAIRHPRNTIAYIYNELIGNSTHGESNTGHGIHVRDNYVLHLKAARKYGLKPIKTGKELKQHIDKGYLVKVCENEGYNLSPFMISDRVLTLSAYSALQTIADRFSRETENGNYFTVTSLTRTVDYQKKLSNSNHSATRGISSHNYGCSFDISYMRFNGIQSSNKELQRILERVLLDLRKEGRILLIAENSTKCYHITAVKQKIRY